MQLHMAGLTESGRRLYAKLRHRLLVKERRQYQQTLRAASTGMTRIRSLPKLLNLIARVTVASVQISHATIFLRNRGEADFTTAVSRGKLKKPIGEIRVQESAALVALMIQRRKSIVYEELKQEFQEELKRSQKRKEPKGAGPLKHALWDMERLQAAVCVPSFMEKKLQGFIVLGEKLSGDLFDQDDLSVFSALAAQAAMAIENAQAYEELRDTRDQLLHSERMSTIGKFAADMAHEIKNPLQAILGFFEMLPEKYDDPDFRNKFAKLAQSEAERINDLVRQLMVYAKPRAPELKPIEISQAIDGVLALLENDFDRNHIEVRKGYSLNGVTVEADRDQMKQVFLNLFTNAIEAMAANKERAPLLDIVAFPSEKALVVKVRDTGSGIAESQMPLIFAPFFTTKEKGSGLGLAIVQNILRAHNATIQVESQVGVGTTVTIAMPRRQSDLPAHPQAPKRLAMTADEPPSKPARKAPSAASILVVDSEADVLESVSAIFEERGITCWTATSGPQALALLKKHQPDFVLSEILLKGNAPATVSAEGFGILQEAKKVLPERPVFLITACDLPEFREKAKELGADGYLIKPASRDQLLGILPGPANR